MKLTLNRGSARRYKSASQRARVLSESWVAENAFCPNCGSPGLEPYPNNRPVADFYCCACTEEFELKSKQGTIGGKIVDGAYRSMIERLESDTNPNLLVLTYDIQEYIALNFFVVPKRFFVPGIIEERKPLPAGARRAGWVGANILLRDIPNSGKIFIVDSQRVISKEEVLSEWKRTLFLKDSKRMAARGWTLDIMRCVERFDRREFSLADIYAFEGELAGRHPDNKHIRDKIRQQLQVLRDNGYLEFVSRGKYRLN